MKIVLDCAHGATYHIAPMLFRELGADVVAIGAEPNGVNINDGVGSMHIDNPPPRCVKPVRTRIAFDGDGDRVLMADDGATRSMAMTCCTCWRRRGSATAACAVRSWAR